MGIDTEMVDTEQELQKELGRIERRLKNLQERREQILDELGETYTND